MRFVDAKFNWDLGNTEKCQKHGLTIAEIEAFFSVDLMVFEDIRWSAVSQLYGRSPPVL
jgi:uncharacterized DUF497 family protein